MNKEIIQAIIGRLLKIKDKTYVNIYWDIRNSLEIIIFDGRSLPKQLPTEEWLNTQIALWPECHVDASGNKDISYPVGGHDEYWMEQYQNTIWENPKRLRLVEFLIMQAEQQLKE